MGRRTYSDREKAEALAALEANSDNLTRTAEDLGIPRSTLQYWRDGGGVNGEVTKLRHQKKQSLADKLGEIAEALAGDLFDETKRRRASIQQIATSMAIVIDKMQLLRGDPTTIERRDDTLTPDERAARLAELLDAAGARRDRRDIGDTTADV